MFYLPVCLPENWVECLAANAAPEIESLEQDAIGGWVTTRHLLDRNITEESVTFGEHGMFVLMSAARKIPSALLQANCRIEEAAEIAASPSGYITKIRKMEIRKAVSERLLPEMPPTLGGLAIIVNPESGHMFATGISYSNICAIRAAFLGTFPGVDVVEVTAATAALQRHHILARDLAPTTFVDGPPEMLFADNLGPEFLTWLWYIMSESGGMVGVEGCSIAISLDGPLTLVHDGDEGAFEVVVKHGKPTLSGEAVAAMRAGKRLSSAKLTLARGDEICSAMFDASEFIFRSLKLPRSDEFTMVEKACERINMLEDFFSRFLLVFDRFITQRAKPKLWKPVEKAITQWIADGCGTGKGQV